MSGATIEYSSNAPAPLSFPRLPSHHILKSGEPDYLRLILTAKVYDLIKETPLVRANGLCNRLGNEIWLKREDLQEVFSFKIRGAYNFMAHVPPSERWKGVVTCSAGVHNFYTTWNHAQGVAMSGTHLHIPCTVVMPNGTPTIKVRNVERFGAKVVLYGADFDEAKVECIRLAAAHDLIFVPPFDDPLIIAGQGTIGMEILKQVPDSQNLDGIFASVGGGGLVAGIASYVKRVGAPTTKIIGVETMDADAMSQSLAKGERVTLSEVGPFADGTAVKIVGEETFRVCKDILDEIVKADNDEICAAIKDIFEDTRSITEPSGALGLAGLKRYIQDNDLVGAGKRFVVVVSGANMNFGRLRFVAERAELGEGREALFSVEIPDTPGSFVELHSVIHPRAVTEFSYRWSAGRSAHLFLSFILSTSSRHTEVAEFIKELHARKMTAYDISDDEMAKSHARYMVGGASDPPNERLIRFEFPERPLALRKFLLNLQMDTWNITLFHYRNHGADLGRVLAGIQVPPGDAVLFDKFLDRLGYQFMEETNNPVYRRFLRTSE